jgi:hypothetical protein
LDFPFDAVFRVPVARLRPAVVAFLRPAAVAFFLADEDLPRAVDALLRAGEDLRLDVLRPPPVDNPSSLSLPSLISFLATPTAAGVGTPSAVPATIFWGVDSPPSSSLAMSTSCAL